MFSVNRLHAGKADLVVKINGPRGNTLPFTMNQTVIGEHVVYTPRERGPHLIYITYGGLDVPGPTFSSYNVTACSIIFFYMIYCIQL